MLGPVQRDRRPAVQALKRRQRPRFLDRFHERAAGVRVPIPPLTSASWLGEPPSSRVAAHTASSSICRLSPPMLSSRTGLTCSNPSPPQRYGHQRPQRKHSRNAYYLLSSVFSPERCIEVAWVSATRHSPSTCHSPLDRILRIVVPWRGRMPGRHQPVHQRLVRPHPAASDSAAT